MKPLLAACALDHIDAIYAGHTTDAVYWDTLRSLNGNLPGLPNWKHGKLSILQTFDKVRPHHVLIKLNHGRRSPKAQCCRIRYSIHSTVTAICLLGTLRKFSVMAFSSVAVQHFAAADCLVHSNTDCRT